MSLSASCIIVDDEPLAIRLLTTYVERIPELELAGTFQGPLAALAFLRERPVDLVFLDIQMPSLTGMEVARTLQPRPAIIFTTAYRDYAVESYELAVIDYLVKPIAFPRFYQAVERFLQSRTELSRTDPLPQSPPVGAEEPPYRYFNVNKKYVKVYLEEIAYVESQKEYLRIFTAEEDWLTKGSIAEFADSLPAHFLRIHRSFVINLHHLTAFTAHTVELGEREVPIGSSYQQLVQERLRKSL